jgi:hypothetical protein
MLIKSRLLISHAFVCVSVRTSYKSYFLRNLPAANNYLMENLLLKKLHEWI